MISTLLVSVLLWQSDAVERRQVTAPAPPQPVELVVVVAMPVYQPDGAVRAETVALPAAGAGLVHVFSRRNVCEPAISGAREPTDAAFGWRVASQIVARSDKDVVVSVDWRRVWDAGRKVNNGPGGSVQLTLHPGDRIPLDHIPNASPKPDCRAVGLGLEVRLSRTAPAPVASVGSIPLGATAGGAKPVDAELWLTHTLPTGTEQVLHQIVRVPAAGGRFSFAPTSFSTARGDVSVELTGSLDRYRTPAGGEFLVVSMTRIVTGADLPAAGITGTTGAVIPMPGPTDVQSFEMPGAASRARGGAAGGSGAGGSRGGGGAAAGGGGMGAASGGTGGVRTGASGAVAGGTARGSEVQVGARGGGRGGGAVAGAQLATLLEGHQFSLRLQVHQIN